MLKRSTGAREESAPPHSPKSAAESLAKSAGKSLAKKAAKTLVKSAARSAATSLLSAGEATAETGAVAGEGAAAEAGGAIAAEAGGAAAGAGLAATGVGIVVLAGAAAGIAAKVAINNDNKKREAYTQQFVQQAAQKYPGYNLVVCHPKHTVSGANVIHQHYELPMTVGTCGYDIYFALKGRPFTFVNQGDAGFVNWAFNGEFNRNGNTLTAVQHG
jgi:hypothetical protein